MNGAELAGLFERLERSTRATYDLRVAPEALAYLRDAVFQVPLGLDSHRALVRDVMAGAEVNAGHPYRAYYDTLDPNQQGSGWDFALKSKQDVIRGIAADGVREPVDAYFTNLGLAYFHGYHRLAAALELGHAEIPVRAHLVDAELAELAARLFGIYEGDLRFTLYQPVNHPFFRLYPVQPANAAWSAKVAAVIGAAASWSGLVIEVGAHTGSLTRALRAAGVYALATDVDPLYLELQPLFEAIGLGFVPYVRRGIQDLVSDPGPVRLVIMGLAHHLLGKPDLWASMRADVLPWMRRAVPEAVVELSLLPTYLGGPAAVALTSDDEVQAFWAGYGYEARRLVDGTMRRVTYHVRWAGSER